MAASAKNLKEWWMEISPEMLGQAPAMPPMGMGQPSAPIGMHTGFGPDGVLQPQRPVGTMTAPNGQQALVDEGELVAPTQMGGVQITPAPQAQLMRQKAMGQPAFETGGYFGTDSNKLEYPDWASQNGMDMNLQSTGDLYREYRTGTSSTPAAAPVKSIGTNIVNIPASIGSSTRIGVSPLDPILNNPKSPSGYTPGSTVALNDPNVTYQTPQTVTTSASNYALPTPGTTTRTIDPTNQTVTVGGIGSIPAPPLAGATGSTPYDNINRSGYAEWMAGPGNMANADPGVVTPQATPTNQMADYMVSPEFAAATPEERYQKLLVTPGYNGAMLDQETAWLAAYGPNVPFGRPGEFKETGLPAESPFVGAVGFGEIPTQGVQGSTGSTPYDNINRAGYDQWMMGQGNMANADPGETINNPPADTATGATRTIENTPQTVTADNIPTTPPPEVPADTSSGADSVSGDTSTFTPPTPPETPAGMPASFDYYRQGMDALSGIAKGDSALQRTIANRTIGAFGGAAAASQAAQRQQGAQQGLSASTMGTMEQVGNRDTGSQLSQLQGKLAEGAQAEAIGAAEQLVTGGISGTTAESQYQAQQATAKKDKFLTSVEFGDDATVRAAYKEYFGVDMDPGSTTEDIRNYARTLRAQTLAIGEENVSQAEIATRAAELGLSADQMSGVIGAIKSGITDPDVLNRTFGTNLTATDIAGTVETFNIALTGGQLANRAAREGITAQELGNIAAKNSITTWQTSQIFDMADKGFDVKTINETLGTELSDQQYADIVGATPLGQMNYNRMNALATTLLAIGGEDNIRKAGDVLSSQYPAIFGAGGDGINVDELITEDNAADFADGMASFAEIAQLYDSFDEAFDEMTSSGTIGKLGEMPEASMRRMYNTMKVNALDEEWNVIEGSSAYKALSDEAKANTLRLHQAKVSGELEWDFVEEYNIYDESGKLIDTVAGLGRATAMTAGTKLKAEPNGDVAILPKDMIAGATGAGSTSTGAAKTPEYNAVRNNVATEEYFINNGKMYTKGSGDASTDTQVVDGEYGEWSTQADYILKNGKDTMTKEYNDIINDRVASIETGEHTVSAGELTYDSPVYKALLGKAKTVTAKIKTNPVSSGEAKAGKVGISLGAGDGIWLSEERIAEAKARGFDLASNVDSGTFFKAAENDKGGKGARLYVPGLPSSKTSGGIYNLNGKAYKLDGMEEFAHSGEDNGLEYYLTDLVSGQKYKIRTSEDPTLGVIGRVSKL